MSISKLRDFTRLVTHLEAIAGRCRTLHTSPKSHPPGGHDGEVITDAEASVSYLDLGGGRRFMTRAQHVAEIFWNREEASP